MFERKKKKKRPEMEGAPGWMLTYGDMTTLVMTFFIALLTAATIQGKEMQLILSAFQGSFGIFPGGKTLSAGQLAEMGNVFETLPSEDRGRGMARALKEAQAVLESEVKSRKIVVVDLNERGIRISLSSDAYFKKASAEIDIDSAREVLYKLSRLITGEYMEYKIRIEGHTDDSPTDPNGPWPTNWHLSSARALNVLNYLVDFGARENQLSMAGYGEFRPLYKNDTEEHRSKNRRIDIIILREN